MIFLSLKYFFFRNFWVSIFDIFARVEN